MQRTYVCLTLIVAAVGLGWAAGTCTAAELSNSAYHLVVNCTNDQVNVTLDDLRMDFRLAEGPYYYRAVRQNDKQTAACRGLEGASVEASGSRLTIRGKLAGVDVEHTFDLPADRPIMEERFVVRNSSGLPVALGDFQASFVRPITDAAGKILPEAAHDRFVAVPSQAGRDQAELQRFLDVRSDRQEGLRDSCDL